MDIRLIEAAQTGNVNQLQKLIEDVPNVLRAAALEADDPSPLHIACMGGHHDFVKQVLALMPEFATKLNLQGFSPLHIASAFGHVESVNEILEAVREDHRSCLLKGREGRIPLHCAVIQGRIQVIELLLAACPDCVQVATARGETALHLAVKYYQLDTCKYLVQHLNGKKDIFNSKDAFGNTILHLAASRKQFEVIDILVKEHIDTIEVNTPNNRGLTALDVISMFQTEARDVEIEDILRQVGAKRFAEVDSSMDTTSINNNSSNIQPATSEPKWLTKSLTKSLTDLHLFQYDKNREKPSEARDAILVIAALITAATYQAVLSPPGGFWQDEVSSDPLHKAGYPIMLSRNGLQYYMFALFNSLGFIFSIGLIMIFSFGFPFGKILLLALGFLLSSQAIAGFMHPSYWKGLSYPTYVCIFISIALAVFPVLMVPIVKFLVQRLTQPQRS